ncbi:MAG: NTP transferase domain-containing protein [Candidatus Thermoplasmatota archaeon]|nr:NTP transferase domain-containing protein [Candidatus Thermoplasmatota archaeon]
MKALILAAGESTRMMPLTANIPKPLLFVGGKPFLEHTILALRDTGIKEITLLVGYQKEKIKDYFKDGKKLGVKIRYAEQKERLGTAHAVGTVKMKNNFLCINGDVVITKELINGLMDFYRKHNGPVVTGVNVKHSKEFGVLKVKNSKLKDITEKPKKPRKCLINAGVYVFTPDIFDFIRKTKKSKRGEYEITSSIRMMMDKNDVRVFVSKNEWVDIGRAWDLLDANRIYLEGMRKKVLGKIEKNTTIHGPIMVGKGSIIRNGSYIEGPVFIGKNCDIGPNCYVRAYTSIGDNCRIGNAVEIKNSVIMQNTKIPHHSYVGDSIIGENCNLGSGTKTANLRLDEKNIFSFIKGKRIDTGRRKLGVVMGDNVKTGINSMLDVGTVIGENSFIGPGCFVKGWIKPNSMVCK